jgi:hypothetical protein
MINSYRRKLTLAGWLASNHIPLFWGRYDYLCFRNFLLCKLHITYQLLLVKFIDYEMIAYLSVLSP